jgi:hypothetical protein
MIFIDNKYTKIYYCIVDAARARDLSKNTYKEVHHIIPRSLSGSNLAENLVALTAREHFLCHWLLTKMTSGCDQQKMIFAFTLMLKCRSRLQERYCTKLTARLYEKYKLLDSDIKKKLYKGRIRNTTKYKFCHVDGRTEECSILEMSQKHNLLRSSVAHLVRKPEGKHHVKGWSVNIPIQSMHRSDLYTGPGGPNYDQTVYIFMYKNGTLERCTKYELFTKYSLSRNGIYDICSGKQHSSQGWVITLGENHNQVQAT